MRLFRTGLVLFALIVVVFVGSFELFAAPDAEQKFDPKLFQELRWRSIGPFRGGRALAVTGVRGQSELFYFGSVDGGVWRTNDAGRGSETVSYTHLTLPTTPYV